MAVGAGRVGEGVRVDVAVGVGLAVGVLVAVGAGLAVGVGLIVAVGLGVLDGVLVGGTGDGPIVAVGVIVGGSPCSVNVPEALQPVPIKIWTS